MNRTAYSATTHSVVTCVTARRAMRTRTAKTSVQVSSQHTQPFRLCLLHCAVLSVVRSLWVVFRSHIQLTVKNTFLCLCQFRLARGIMFSSCPSVCPSVRPSVRYQTCEHNILKTNERVCANCEK